MRGHVYFTTTVFLLIFLVSGASILWFHRINKRLHESASFLPVCATCKKVRPVDSDSLDPDSWITIEEYFTRETDARLTHGMCPECFKRVMKENDL